MKRACGIIGMAIFFVSCFPDAKAQTDSPLLQTILSELASQSEAGEESGNVEHIYENLEQLTDNPVRINYAERDDLSRLFWLSEFQINSLLDHIKHKGAIRSPYEIAYLYGFTPELAQSLEPYITLDAPPTESKRMKPAQMLRYGKYRLTLGAQTPLQRAEGYRRPDTAATRYLGSPLKTYLRFAYSSSNRLFFGITAEKDAGEAFFRGSNPYGYDYYSAYLQIHTAGLLKTLTVGDFRANFGQGLALWSGLSYGKTALLLNAMRYNEGLRRHSSTDENRFLRGAGISLALRSWELSLFASRKAIDATIPADDDQTEPTATAFPTTGYHRTDSEIAQKDNVIERIAGGNLSFNRNRLHIGTTAVVYDYSHALTPNLSGYRHYAFAGSNGGNASVDFRFQMGQALVYGEQAINNKGAAAGIYGLQMQLGEHLSANLLYRNYDRRYYARYGTAFGENSQNSNEEGFYLGGNLNLGGLWTVAAYTDIFSFPWMRYRADAPSVGHDAFVRTAFTPSNKTNATLQIRYRQREENAGETVVSRLAKVKTLTAKLIWRHSINEHLSLGNQLEMKNYRKETARSQGYFVAQDVRADLLAARQPLQITFRFAMFDTDDFNSAIYAYENDMLYAFSIPAFSDKGIRIYLLTKYSIGKHFDIRIRYALTSYSHKNVVGSGLNTVNGNHISDLKFQIVCKF